MRKKNKSWDLQYMLLNLCRCCWFQVCWPLVSPVCWTHWGLHPKSLVAAARTSEERALAGDMASRNTKVTLHCPTSRLSLKLWHLNMYSFTGVDFSTYCPASDTVRQEVKTVKVYTGDVTCCSWVCRFYRSTVVTLIENTLGNRII